MIALASVVKLEFSVQITARVKIAAEAQAKVSAQVADAPRWVDDLLSTVGS